MCKLLSDDGFLDYTAHQFLQSGDIVDMLVHDFDGDGYSELVTIDTIGMVRFYANTGSGFIDMNHPVQVLDGGKLKVLDLLNNGRMEVVVEVKPEVEQVIDTGQIFNAPLVPPSGKRAIVAFEQPISINWIPVYSQLSTNEAVVGLRSDLMLSVAQATDLLTFTNKEIDYNLDLHYFGARYYHSTFPRFISPDPVSGNPMSPISWNRYLSCRNDPVNYFDPDGELEHYFMTLNNQKYTELQNWEVKGVYIYIKSSSKAFSGDGKDRNNPK